ncbi:MAG TPA: hypothetical protein VHF22_00720, partial [Planctomycetota bacterium]|nr:hypothetical protein [Planctomycetota bacterium]
ERVFGQSAEAAKKFQVAQLAMTGAMSVVNGVSCLAKAWDAKGDRNPFTVPSYYAAAGLYFAAAGLAGVATGMAAGQSVGASAGADSGLTNPDRFAETRKNVTVVIERYVGAEDFVDREVIPIINSAVRRDKVVFATHSATASAVAPGRYRTTP